METEEEAGVIWPQAKECQWLLAVPRSREAWDPFFLRASRKN